MEAEIRAIEEREAKYGQKMIEVKVRFWTDSIAETKGNIEPKRAWSSGVVRIQRNPNHGITPGSPIPFNSLMDLTAKIEKLLIQQGITLLPSRVMRKYMPYNKTKD
jgi:hypothetical protein